jgi:uncharacterized membrane protein YkvI
VAPILFLSGKGLNIDNYHQIFYKFLPRFLAITFDIIFAFFFLGSFAVMLTGSGALLEESFDIYYFFGVIITLFIIFITLILKVEGMYKINSYFIPFILIITLLVIIRFIPEISLSFIKGVLLEKINLGGGKTIWLRDAVLYGTYNLSMASGVMIGIAVNEKKRTVIRGSIFGGVILFVLNVLIFLGLKTAYYQSPSEQIPMLYLATTNGGLLSYLYIFGLFFAMVSTAIANCYALTQRLKFFGVKYKWGLISIIILVLPLLNLSFSYLVETLYPLFGYMGLIILAYIILIYLYRKVSLSRK